VHHNRLVKVKEPLRVDVRCRHWRYVAATLDDLERFYEGRHGERLRGHLWDRERPYRTWRVCPEREYALSGRAHFNKVHRLVSERDGLCLSNNLKSCGCDRVFRVVSNHWGQTLRFGSQTLPLRLPPQTLERFAVLPPHQLRYRTQSSTRTSP